MKYIYIAGLEHSGTTLLNHLLCQHPSVVGLGEVASFFSPSHMDTYFERWGTYPDVDMCSCGRRWIECEFWGQLIQLSGLESDLPSVEKYKVLLDHIRRTYGAKAVVVDSSKSLAALTLLTSPPDGPLEPDDVLVIHAVKDVRGFAASVLAKSPGRPSLVAIYRTFNWWIGANRALTEFSNSSRLRTREVLYENMCRDVEGTIRRLLDDIELAVEGGIQITHNRSHIAMGNKNFAMRNRETVRYDDRWFLDDRINLVYLLHPAARRLNKRFYARGGRDR